jgi:hypothetical protein
MCLYICLSSTQKNGMQDILKKIVYNVAFHFSMLKAFYLIDFKIVML